MNIIPVLDLMGGQVVQAIRGEREHYQPVRSVLIADTEPLSVARALQAETGCSQFYIADLDAMTGRGNQREIIRQLSSGLEADLWVDAAVTDVSSARKVLEAGVDRVIVCSETLPDRTVLRTIRNVFPAEQLLFSLDIVKGRVLSPSSSLHGEDPLVVLELLLHEGWAHLILLTLDQVGTGNGPDWELISIARHRFPELSLIAGGGVRTLHDLNQLAVHHVNGALVATSLHRGWITRKDLLTLASGG